MKMHAALKRGLALFLTLAMMVSIVYQGGYMHAHAENDVPSKSIGQLFVENYDELSDAEKALYGSGLLAGVSYSYKAPTDAALVSVNTESKVITAGDYTDSEGNAWDIDRAEIVVGEEVKETVSFTGNTATYTYDGNAFSVRVYYALTLSGVAGQIAAQIDSAVALKDGLAAAQTVLDQEGSLYILEQAMPELVELAENGYTISGQQTSLSAEAVEAITALNGQMTANNGFLDLSVIRSAYAAAPSKVNYILTQGEGMLTCVEETQAYVAAIEAELVKAVDAMDAIKALFPDAPEMWERFFSETLYNQVNTLLNNVSATNTALQTVMAANWTAAEKGAALVKADITAAEYVELDSLLGAVDGFTPVAIEDTLFVDEAYIQYNLSMFDVNVSVELWAATGIAGDSTLYQVGMTYTAPTATLSEGASAAEIQTVIDAAIASAKEGWAAEYISDNYVVVTEYEVPGALNKDLEYKIVFEPVDCLVELYYGSSPAHQYLPYGYKMPLTTYYGAEGTNDKVYDYTVNDVYYPEGSVITIEGHTEITRVEGEPYDVTSLYALIAEQYAADDATTSAVLTSGAVIGDEYVAVRTPDFASLVTVTEDADSVTVTANTFDAGERVSADWAPVKLIVHTGNSVEEIAFNGASTLTFNNVDYDRVEVLYELDLSADHSNAKVEEILAISAALTDDAKDQTEALARLVAKMGEMEQLTGAMMAALKGMIAETQLHDNPVEDARLKALFTAQVETIQKNCMQNDAEAAANGNVKYLYILKYLEVYTDANNGGLDYYYENADAIIQQVGLLGDSLSAMLAGENEKAALSKLLNAATYGSYAEKIESMADIMAEVKADLSAPSALIDVNSANLEKLTDALTGTAQTYTGVAPLVLTGSYSKDSSKNVTLSLNYSIDAKAYATAPITMLKVDTVTEAMVAAIKADIEAKIAAVLGDNDTYYNNNYDASALDALVGMTGSEAVAALADLSYDWTAKGYTVKIDGQADQIITIHSLKVNLPASGNNDIRWDYIIGGNTVSSGSYTFTPAELTALFGSGSYTVTRVVVDVARENLISFVDGLNEGTAASGITFALIENMGEYSIVMKLDTANLDALKSAVTGMAMQLVNYDYIGIGGNGLKYTDENGNAKLSIQAVVDAIMNSGMTLDDLCNAVHKNDMSKLDIIGSVISNAPMGQYGGKLVVSTMEIANAESSYPLYITVGSAHEYLNKIVAAYEKPLSDGGPALKNFIQMECSNGAANVTVTLPDKAYQAYLAGLLVTGEISMADIDVTAIDTKIAYEFISDLVPALSDEEVTLDSWLNTLVMMGVIDSTNISYKNILTQAYDAVCGIWAGVEFENDDLAAASGNVAIKAVMDKLAADYKELMGMIVEYESGLELAATVTLANTNTYNAIYVDTGASDVINNAGMTTISGDMAFAGYTVLVLTDDVTANITCADNTLINLNGHTINGNVTFGATSFVVDTANGGAINGTVSGTYYMSTEDIYDLVKDENGNITVVVDADAVVSAEWGVNSAITLAVDVLADMIFNGYVNSELYVEGNKLYDVELSDLVGLYTGDNRLNNLIEQISGWISNPELMAVLDSIVDELTNYDSMAAAEWVNGEKVLVSYDVATAPWNINLDGAESGDYVTLNVTGGDVDEFTLSFAVASDDNQAIIDKALNVLADTVTITTELEGTQNVEGKTLELGWKASGCLYVDLTSNTAYAKALCAILACGSDAMADADFSDIAELEEVFNNVTVSDAIWALRSYDPDVVSELSGISNAQVLTIGSYLSQMIDYILNFVPVNTESERTLGSFYKTVTCGCGETHTGYGATRADLSKSGDVTAKGITLDLTAEIGYATVMLNIWPEKAPAHEHSYTAVVTPPTCTEQGYTTYTCACGDSYVADYVDALGHSYIGVVTAPTCTADGYTTYTCSVCGDTYVADYVDALGHSYVKAEGDDAYKAPTCTQDGYQKYVCSVCGATYTEVIPATGHTHSDEWSKNADGHWHECACGDAVDFDEHTYGDWMSNGDGTKTHVCDICGYEETANEEAKPDVPKTGDEAPVVLMTALMVTAAAAAIVLVVRKKRERN